ncbi:MAG: sugar phosphate isomerase/epimerase [Chloroflexaceae bacterium]|nr:sugar phosphate isomerase/epimerase [Chloroflexaceae bacterium]NJL33218.1 sugar phosphate isomerase/epimerase [Chloroflexaceae bacterium]
MALQTLPIVGAALPIRLLPLHLNWLLEAQRDLEIQDPAVRPNLLDTDWRPLVHEARVILDGYQGRLGIHGPYDGIVIKTRDRRVRQLAIERLQQALAFAAELGATQMVMHSPFLFLGDSFVPHSFASSRARVIEQVHQVIDAVLPLAVQIGCELVFENVLDGNPAPLLALVQSFSDAAVRVSLDTGHAAIAHRQGGTAPAEWVTEVGALLGHLHLQDNDGRADRHWCPGDGEVDWHALFAAVGSLAHRPRLLIELHHHDQIPKAAAWFAAQGLAR